MPAPVEALVEREMPLIWRVGNKMRVLHADLSARDRTLLLLHASAGPMRDDDLFDSVEYSRLSAFRRDVLRPAHRNRLIEFDERNELVTISPRGVEHAERLLRERLAAA